MRAPWLCILWAALSLEVPAQLSEAEMKQLEAKLPPASDTQVDFEQHIRPILDESCIRCHGTERPKGDFRLVSRAHALKGGANGLAIVPGESARSPLIYYVARLVEDMEMPPTEKDNKPLTAEQVG